MGEESNTGWSFSLTGSDARFFTINSEGLIQFFGKADHEIKPSYELYIEATNSEGSVYQSHQTIEVTDRNDQPTHYFSHANNFLFFDETTSLASRLFIGIKEEVENPYVMTLSIEDQDLTDSHTIEITYTQQGVSGPAIDITNLFSFDSETGSLSFIGRLDYENNSSLSGIDDSHRWYDPITITVTDSSGSKDTLIVLMDAWDSSSDGFYNGNASSYFNFSSEGGSNLLTGPIDIDTFKYPELMRIVNGDINGDGIPDMVSLYKNTDYYDPADYGMVQISLGGEFSFPYYSSGIYTWGGTNNWNSVIGNGIGSVIVRLPYSLDLRGQTDYIRGFDVGDFNGDGYSDFFLQIGNFIVAGWGDASFLNSSVQGQNIMDLSSIESDSTNGLYVDLNDYTDNQVQLLAIGDLNRDGKDDLVFTDYQGSVYILDGKINLIDTINFRTISGDSIQQNNNFGDSVVIGDFNGDGRQDLAITADGYDKTPDGDEGAILIYLNSFGGLSATPSVTIKGDFPSDEIGWYGIVNLGDINNDGNDDLGFGDDDFISYIFWGKSVFSPVYDIATESQNSVNFSALDNNTIAGFYISDAVPIGDINGDGFDDLAVSTSEKIIVLYGMQNWQTIYENSAGLNTLEILTGAYADIYALGDIDGDGKDEFGYTYTTGEAASINDGLIIWNGTDTPSDTNGFSISLKQNYFSIDENISGAVIGKLELDGNININNYDLIIQSVSSNGQEFDGDLFELTSDGTLKLLDGVFLNADEYSEIIIFFSIADQANDQISQQVINIQVNNINEQPSINLSNRFVDDTATAGSVIGTLSGSDPDNDELTYILTGADADKFIIDAATNEIKFADGVVVDVNDQVSYSVTITAKDPYGLESTEQVVIEVNVAPIDIILETNIIQESVRGAAIGQIEVTDKNETDEFTYSISGEDSWMFNVTSEGILELAEGIYADFESEEILNITITATDILGQSVSKDFSINTVDINYSNPEISDTIFSNFVIPLSGDPYIDSMLFGFTLDPDNDFNTSLTITYSIPGADSIFIDPYYYEGSGYGDAPNNIVNPSNSFISAIDEIFTYIGNLLGINFVKVEETGAVVGDIRCAILIYQMQVGAELQ